MAEMKWYDWVIIGLMTAGGVNWGLIGFFDFNLVEWVARQFAGALFMAWANVVYMAVGIASAIGFGRVLFKALD